MADSGLRLDRGELTTPGGVLHKGFFMGFGVCEDGRGMRPDLVTGRHLCRPLGLPPANLIA